MIPDVFRTRMLTLQSDEAELVDELSYSSSGDEPPGYDVLTNQRIDILRHDILEIRAAARECQNESSSEPEWICEVHSRLLRLALEPSRSTSHVWMSTSL